jgi:hypothetical protein|tara:strand:+ start:337 stop:504 length:168 start_codon:yes stop_codon:yes gene_type:complete
MARKRVKVERKNKDATVFVTGVSMSGKVKDDDNRAPEGDQTQSEGEAIGDSREDD